MHYSSKLFIVGASFLMGAVATSCVDHDYDLDKDIDLTVQVGGDHLTLPPSNTEPYSLERILNLKEGSAIVADADGNYRLEQSGDPSDTWIKVDRVNIDQAEGNTDRETIYFPAVPSSGGSGYMYIDLGGASADNTTGSRRLVNTIDIKASDVDKALIEVDEVTTSLELELLVNATVQNYSGDITFVKGFAITFPDNYTVESTVGYMTAQGSKLVFNADHAIPNASTLKLPIYIKKVKELKNALNASTHVFTLKDEVYITGKLAIDVAKATAGTTPELDLSTDIDIAPGAQILAVNGIVDPEIDIDDIEFSINDVPDFLRGDGNVLDVENPQIYLNINNTTEATVDVAMNIRSTVGDRLLAQVPVSFNVKPGRNYICISRLETTGNGITQNVVEPALSSLITTIPDDIQVTVTKAKVRPERINFTLAGPNDSGYEFLIENRVIVPLAFGPDMKLVYTEQESDWDKDGNLHKYSFGTATITAKVQSSLPLTMKPSVTPVFKNGIAPSVTVDTHGAVIPAGTIEKPATTDITITLQAKDGKTLEGLDGIEYTFEGSDPVVGENLNRKQAIKFSDVVIRIDGGITIDLNKDDK